MSAAVSRRFTISPSAVTYFFLVAAPTPESPLRSIESTTVGVPPKSGSVTTLALTFAFPENETLSAPPVTTPVTGTRAEVVVDVVVDDVEVATVVLALIVAVCAAAGAIHQGAVIARKSESGTEGYNDLRIFMFRSSWFERGGFDFGRRPELHPLRERDRRGQRPHERRAGVVDLPAQRPGGFLLHRVVALHP